MSTSTANLTDTFAISKDNPILMLPLKIETRFIRIANDPGLSEMMRLTNTVNNFDNSIRENIKETAPNLEKSATNGPKDILEDLKINAFNSLLKIDLENQKSNEEILNIKTLQTKLITEVKKEAISTEKRLKKILSPLSRTQGRVTYRVNYFDRKFEEKLKASSPEDAKKQDGQKGELKK